MNALTNSGPVLTAREAWGDALPEWVLGLAQQCAASSQNKVAKKLGYSAAVVSTVLRNSYQGSMDAVRDRYLGVYEASVTSCPALGTIGLHVCQNWRGKARHLNPANAMNVKMFRACNRCPVFLTAQAKGGSADA